MEKAHSIHIKNGFNVKVPKQEQIKHYNSRKLFLFVARKIR